MIPETGSPKEFKHALLNNVWRRTCICGRTYWTIHKWPNHLGTNRCPECIRTLRINLGMTPEEPDDDTGDWQF